MFVFEVAQAQLPAWRGYTANKSGFLPRRMSWMEPKAAEAANKMMEACGNRIEITDGYRSVITQAAAIRDQKEKRRLFAPPTKSGHNFAFSIDIKVKETLENFRKSGDSELVAVGRDRASLVRWMKRYGWTGIKKESWHFNFLDGHETTIKKIEAIYGPKLVLSNEQVQQALNKLVGKDLEEPLKIDGLIGPKTGAAGKLADKLLGVDDRGAFSIWFRRVLAGAAVELKEV